MTTTNGTKNKARFDRVFYTTPGAWVGNPPEGDHAGHITVDVARIAPALRHIARYYAITDTRISPREANGVQVFIRPRRRTTAPAPADMTAVVDRVADDLNAEWDAFVREREGQR
jgi:hypothetical protein